MDRFADAADQYDPGAVEERVFEYWAETDAYRTAKRNRREDPDAEPFFFVDGPPYTSGAAHMGTTWNKTLKDAYIRYLRMSGYDVTDRPGYDMHGLPIETKVEERLDFENKKDIEAFGMEPFIEECKSFAEEQLEGLQADFRSFGVWMDWENPYKTVSPEYMEAAWWGFKRAHERGLVEQGKRSITQCPRCETAIAKNEVEYHEVEDPSIYVKFPLREREGSLVAWTTTPWTVPANTFIAVDEAVTYAKVRAYGDDGGGDDDGEVLYVASDVVEEVLKKGRYGDYELLAELPGAEMLGWTYEHPLDDRVDHPGGEGAFAVYHADYVEVDRTGLVHSAPGHGQEDFRRGQELGLGVFCPVGGDGVYGPAAGAYEGQFVRDANDDIIADLADAGHLLASETYTHDYGQCWRCDTDIVFLAADQWFITATDIKDELLANIDDSEWYPPEARDERFRNFVEESPDWNVSRQRYWGIPIPIWLPDGGEDSSSNGGGDSEERSSPDHASGQSPRAGAAGGWSGDMADAIVIGSREELAERADQSVDPGALDLHRPTVDELTITENGTTYRRVEDVFDVWLDSSVASWGTLDYPAETEAFEELWPADLIMEAHDQTRGWFWSQLGMGTAALGEIPYETVLMHGYANMPDGRGMSKSEGIVVEPGEVIDEYGADPMRMFLLSVTPQGDDMRFSWEETENMQRDLNILWNVFRFPLPYMRADGVEPAETALDEVELEAVDRWLLSRLSTTAREMTDAWDRYRQDEALDALLSFVVGDLSRFYVQLVRERLWDEAATGSKRAAYATLSHVLVETTKLLAPYAPFVSERIYTTLTGDAGRDTVHACDWPTPDPAREDPDLERDIELVRAVEEAGANARQRAGRKLRWPVRRVVVAADDAATAAAVERRRELLCERLNAREIQLVGPDEQWGELAYGARADMSVLGPAFGAAADEVMDAMNAVTVDEPDVDALAAAVADELGRAVELDPEMVEFVTETPADVAGTDVRLDGENRGVVYVDASLTDDIESEGYAREVIRRVQEMRKDLDLEMDAEIRLELDVADDRVARLVDDRRALVAGEVRAAEFGEVTDGYRETWDVEGTEVTLAIEPLATPRASDD